jgi:cell division septal protein FtsQ
MWFGRKDKNRRHERTQHVLDVKLRPSQRRQLRLRRGAMLLGLPLCLFLGAYGAWRGGGYAIEQLIENNPAFAIHQIDVQTDGVIAPEQIRGWAGVKLDDNLFALDLGRVKRDLELVPYIQSAALERVLPHCLKIRVVEREPVAQCFYPRVNADGVLENVVFYLDAQGYIFPPLETQQRGVPAPRDPRLPVCVGIVPGALRSGRQIEAPQVQAALRLIEAFERSPMANLAELKEIDVAAPNVLQVNTGQSCSLTFGLTDWDGQLRRWRAIHDFGRQLGKYVAWIDLSVANNVPARWLETDTAPPPPSKVGKPSRLKKKHV